MLLNWACLFEVFSDFAVPTYCYTTKQFSTFLVKTLIHVLRPRNCLVQNFVECNWSFLLNSSSLPFTVPASKLWKISFHKKIGFLSLHATNRAWKVSSYLPMVNKRKSLPKIWQENLLVTNLCTTEQRSNFLIWFGMQIPTSLIFWKIMALNTNPILITTVKKTVAKETSI